MISRRRAARRRPLIAVLLALAIASVGGIAPALADQTVTDMAGRTVTVPDRLRSVATIGPVPVLNSFIFALGEADTIANNLPPNLGGPRWRLQYVVAPSLATKPILQSSEGANLEALLLAKPELVLTMDRRTTTVLERTQIPALYLSWQQPEDVKTAMRLLGTLYGKTEAAESYCRYFDETLTKVATRIEGLSPEQRPRVLYGSLARLTQPHRIAEWWITKAGGHSVTDDGRSAEAFTFSVEQILHWDPEVIILSTADEVPQAYADARLANVSAIKNRRVYAAPMGAHTWGNRTVEQPLTVLWAAQIFHPDLFRDLSLTDDVRSFYGTFFKTQLSDADIATILAGQPANPKSK